MKLDQRQTTVAYRCPHCGQTVVSVVGVFALSGDMIRLKCQCGESELRITYTPERRIRVTTPCLVCANDHSFVLGSSAFFADRVMTYHCPMTGLELCFIGKKEDVLSAASTADRELLELMDEAGLENLDEIKTENDPESNEDLYFISDVIRFLIAELKEDQAIKCKCEKCEDQDIDFRFVTDAGQQKVEIFCRTCGGSALFPIVSANDAQSFLSTDALKLE